MRELGSILGQSRLATQAANEMEKQVCLLTDHLQGVDIYVSTHHPAFGVQLGAAEAHRHADLSVAVASHRQSALTLEAARRPAAGGRKAGVKRC